MLYHAIEEAFFKFSALSAAGVIAAIAMRPAFVRERELLFLLLGVIAIQVAGIAMQGKFFAYHYAATLPLIATIAGIGLYKLWMRCLAGGAGGAIAFFSFLGGGGADALRGPRSAAVFLGAGGDPRALFAAHYAVRQPRSHGP